MCTRGEAPRRKKNDAKIRNKYGMRNLLSHFLGNCVSFGLNARSSFVKKILNFELK